MTTKYGKTVFLHRGYKIEVMSDYQEWTDRAVNVLETHDALVAALRECSSCLSMFIDDYKSCAKAHETAHDILSKISK